MFRTRHVIGPVVLLSAWAAVASAQTTYHLHTEPSSTANLKQLKVSNPDVPSVAVLTANLKNTALGEKLIKEFDTQATFPGLTGVIPSGSIVTVKLWIKKTANFGMLFPRAKVFLNSGTGTSVGPNLSL